MVRRRVAASALIVVLGVLAASVSAWAHHGSAAYADEVTVLKDATVTVFQWANPHSFIRFDAKDESGQVVHWAAEAGSPSALSLIGWSKSAIQPGDKITVYVFQSKSGTPVGRLNKIVMEDGTEYLDSQLGNGPRNGAGRGNSQ